MLFDKRWSNIFNNFKNLEIIFLKFQIEYRIKYPVIQLRNV